MDGFDPTQLQQLLELLNAGGVTVVLIMLVTMFIRGDLVPRKVYERLLRDTLTKIAADIIAAVTLLLKDQNQYSNKQIDELKKRFNRIEDCIEGARKGDI